MITFVINYIVAAAKTSTAVVHFLMKVSINEHKKAIIVSESAVALSM